jgi:hypothetical protein
MFPTDALTITHEQVGAGSYTFFSSGVHYILGLFMQQSGQASDTILLCGTTEIAKNYAKDLFYSSMQYRCDGTLKLTKTGNDKSFMAITYVERDLSVLPTTASMSASVNDAYAVAWLLAGIFVFTIGAWIGSQALRR